MSNFGKRMVSEKEIKTMSSKAYVDSEVGALNSDLRDEIDARAPKEINNIPDFTKYVVNTTNETIDFTGALKTLCLIKTSSCSQEFYDAFDGVKVIGAGPSDDPASDLYIKGGFLLVDDSNSASVKFTILLTCDAGAEIGVNPQANKYRERLIKQAGNNDFVAIDCRLFRYDEEISVPNDYSNYTRVVFGQSFAYDQTSPVRLIYLKNTRLQDVTNISSSFSTDPCARVFIQASYRISGVHANQPNYAISALPPADAYANTNYLLRAKVGEDGIFSGFDWVLESDYKNPVV